MGGSQIGSHTWSQCVFDRTTHLDNALHTRVATLDLALAGSSQAYMSGKLRSLACDRAGGGEMWFKQTWQRVEHLGGSQIVAVFDRTTHFALQTRVCCTCLIWHWEQSSSYMSGKLRKLGIGLEGKSSSNKPGSVLSTSEVHRSARILGRNVRQDNALHTRVCYT